MVLARPPFVDVSGLHGAVGTAHADRAEVDVAQKNDHDQHCTDGVDDVRKLHVLAWVAKPRDQLVEHEPGGNHDAAENEHATPEQELLAGVVAARGRLLAAEETAALEKPVEVAPARPVATQELS